MNPQNSRELVRRVFGFRLQLLAIVTLLTAFAFAAGDDLIINDYPPKPHRRTLTISPTTLPDGSTSVAYRAYLEAQGGTGRYRFYHVSGDMPHGLYLRSNGAITGKPRSAGSFSFRVLVTDFPRGDRGEATVSLNIADGNENPNAPVSVTVSPLSASLPSGGRQQFLASVSNTSNTAVTWSASQGTISPNGMFTAPNVTASTNVTVMATSVADSAKNAQASVSVDPPAAVSISIAPKSVSLAAGATQQFSASVSNTSNIGVTWSASSGTISPSGLFTAPNVTSTTNITVTATSDADPSKSAQASVSVTPLAGISVSITPTSANLAPGAAQQFSATVSNTSNSAITWSASNGTISPTGLFTAPNVASPTNITVTATSVADPTKSAQASVSVNALPPVSISITPASASVASGGTQQFSATVSNTSNTGVTWTASNGTISPSGLFTAPTVTTPATARVVATSMADNTQSAQATVAISPASTSGGGAGDNTYCGVGNVPNFGSNDGPAQLPQSCLYTARSATPSPGTVTFAPSGSNLVSVLNAAHCGDVIQLQHGGIFSPVQAIPAKGCDDAHWITVETDAIASLPAEGTRITPCFAGIASLPGRPAYSCPNPQNVMAKIITQCNGGPALDFAPNADHYRFIGIEITRTPGPASCIGQTTVYTLVDLETSTKIIFDQIWLHGDDLTNGDETTHGISLNFSSKAGVIDSYFNDLYCVQNVGACTDAQAIYGGTGNGPTPWGTYKIVNNFLEAAAEPVLFGGVGNSSGTPTDIEIRRNHLFNPLIWNPGDPSYDGGFHGNPPCYKNLLEFKNAIRVLVEGNVLENIWGGCTQVGAAFLLTPVNQDNTDPTAVDADITIRYNLVRRVGQVFQISMTSQCPPGVQGPCPAAGIHNVSIHDIIADHIQYSPGCFNTSCGPYFNQIGTPTNINVPSQALHDLTMNHITEVLDNLSGTSQIALDGPSAASGKEMSNFVWKNSIIPAGQYGIGAAEGNPAACAELASGPSTAMLTGCFSGTLVFGNNLIPWGSTNGGAWSSLAGGGALKLVADQNAVQYVNQSGQDYRLQASSPGHNAADDGTDIGADVNAVNIYTQAVQ